LSFFSAALISRKKQARILLQEQHNVIAVLLGAGMAMLATVLGAAGVFFTERVPITLLHPILAFSAGMMAMSAVEMLNESHALAGHGLGSIGLVVGMVVLVLLAKALPHAHMILLKSDLPSAKKKAAILAGTITLHNIPEGFAIASAFADSSSLGWIVAVSIALQDIPEGLIISMPAVCYGTTRGRSFFYGSFSGVVEFVAAIVGYFFLSALSKAMPFALGFSGGAMLYVVLFELLPDVMRGKGRHKGAVAFVAGIAAAYLLTMLIGM
jgi:zinc transporter, ZIP family